MAILNIRYVRTKTTEFHEFIFYNKISLVDLTATWLTSNDRDVSASIHILFLRVPRITRGKRLFFHKDYDIQLDTKQDQSPELYRPVRIDSKFG